MIDIEKMKLEEHKRTHKRSSSQIAIVDNSTIIQSAYDRVASSYKPIVLNQQKNSPRNTQVKKKENGTKKKKKKNKKNKEKVNTNLTKNEQSNLQRNVDQIFSSVSTFSETPKTDVNNIQTKNFDDKKLQFKQLLDKIKLKKNLPKFIK